MSEDDITAIRERRREELQRRLEGPSTPEDPIEIDGPDHLQEITADHECVIVDFHADWCGPCRQQAPIVASLTETEDLTVAKVDVDACPDVATAHGVRSVPTLVIYADGDPVERLVGLQDEASLRRHVDDHVR